MLKKFLASISNTPSLETHRENLKKLRLEFEVICHKTPWLDQEALIRLYPEEKIVLVLDGLKLILPFSESPTLTTEQKAYLVEKNISTQDLEVFSSKCKNHNKVYSKINKNSQLLDFFFLYNKADGLRQA